MAWGTMDGQNAGGTEGTERARVVPEGRQGLCQGASSALLSHHSTPAGVLQGHRALLTWHRAHLALGSPGTELTWHREPPQVSLCPSLQGDRRTWGHGDRGTGGRGERGTRGQGDRGMGRQRDRGTG